MFSEKYSGKTEREFDQEGGGRNYRFVKVIGRWIVLTALTLSTGLATSCDSETDEEEPFCDLMGHASVRIEVVDTAGDPVLLEPGSAAYAVDGGETRTVPDEFGVVENPVNIFGSEGEYVVTVAPEGYEPGVVTAEVELTSDGCHVVTEERELVLESDAQDGQTG